MSAEGGRTRPWASGARVCVKGGYPEKGTGHDTGTVQDEWFDGMQGVEFDDGSCGWFPPSELEKLDPMMDDRRRKK